MRACSLRPRHAAVGITAPSVHGPHVAASVTAQTLADFSSPSEARTPNTVPTVVALAAGTQRIFSPTPITTSTGEIIWSDAEFQTVTQRDPFHLSIRPDLSDVIVNCTAALSVSRAPVAAESSACVITRGLPAVTPPRTALALMVGASLTAVIRIALDFVTAVFPSTTPGLDANRSHARPESLSEPRVSASPGGGSLPP